jgi:homoserine dehydrogenase
VRIALVENEQRIRQAARNSAVSLIPAWKSCTTSSRSRRGADAALALSDDVGGHGPPLKVGLAGLGTVGASVVRLIEQQRAALTLRCGRPIEIVAVTARSRARPRHRSEEIPLGRDPVALARDPGIDVFVELIGGAGDPAKRAVETALRPASPWSPPTRRCSPARRELAALAERKHVALNFEAAVAARFRS